jgi:hypothetical protein
MKHNYFSLHFPCTWMPLSHRGDRYIRNHSRAAISTSSVLWNRRLPRDCNRGRGSVPGALRLHPACRTVHVELTPLSVGGKFKWGGGGTCFAHENQSKLQNSVRGHVSIVFPICPIYPIQNNSTTDSCVTCCTLIPLQVPPPTEKHTLGDGHDF